MPALKTEHAVGCQDIRATIEIMLQVYSARRLWTKDVASEMAEPLPWACSYMSGQGQAAAL